MVIFRALFVALILVGLYTGPSQAELSKAETIAIVIATTHHAQPDVVQETGVRVGLLKYCPGVTDSQHVAFFENELNWIKLGVTEFESIDGRPGFLNNRHYAKLKLIFDEGFARGKRDGRAVRRKSQFKHQICPELLDYESLEGPPSKIVKLIQE